MARVTAEGAPVGPGIIVITGGLRRRTWFAGRRVRVLILAESGFEFVDPLVFRLGRFQELLVFLPELLVFGFERTHLFLLVFKVGNEFLERVIGGIHLFGLSWPKQPMLQSDPWQTRGKSVLPRVPDPGAPSV
jgi:hypothetical protein